MRKLIVLMFILIAINNVNAQFEEAKLNAKDFTQLKVEIGADFALQYQSLDNVGKLSTGAEFMPIGANINLPTANFNINGYLAPGLRVTLETYLSSRHHNETWVKGGYLLMDDFSFLGSKLNTLLRDFTVKAGVMEINYGDGHFRRTDNGAALKNAFVGSYILDAFTTAPAVEVMYRKNGIVALVATTSGNLNPSQSGFVDNKDGVTDAKDFEPYYLLEDLAFYAKLGYENQLNDDLKVRLTLSPYYQANHYRGTLYGGDRAGERFYTVLVPASLGSAATDIKTNFTNGRWGPGGTKSVASLMVNPFVKFKGAELFGLFETTKGKTVANADFKFNQLAIEAIYRLGKAEQFYIGAKYNTVSNDKSETVNRLEAGGGWFLTRNIITKLIYIDQKYEVAQYEQGTGFKGLMFEAAISF
jgi:hypothetical protein